jgi:hypothetical protein
VVIAVLAGTVIWIIRRASTRETTLWYALAKLIVVTEAIEPTVARESVLATEATLTAEVWLAVSGNALAG